MSGAEEHFDLEQRSAQAELKQKSARSRMIVKRFP
jgi:hypothetical protein